MSMLTLLVLQTESFGRFLKRILIIFTNLVIMQKYYYIFMKRLFELCN